MASNQKVRVGWRAAIIAKLQVQMDDDEIDANAGSHTAQRKERNVRSNIPHPVRGQLLNSLANMYLNAANSGDLKVVQGFFAVYMTGMCPFVVNFDVHRSLGFPAQLCGTSPKMLSHYFLGVFTMYPDCVQRVKRVTVVRCDDEKDRETVAKIFVRCESTGTQVCSLDPLLWVPDVVDKPKAGKKRPRKRKQDVAVEAVANRSAEDASNSDRHSSRRTNGGVSVEDSVTDIDEGCGTALNPASGPTSGGANYISDAYVAQLTASARPLTPVRPIVLDSGVTFYLNHSLQVHHVTVQLRQEFG